MTALSNNFNTAILINNYIDARSACENIDGASYKEDRDQLRAIYASTTATFSTLEPWINTFFGTSLQTEFTSRFKEWDSKIASGRLTRPEKPHIPLDILFEKITNFALKHFKFISSPERQNLIDASNSLKDGLREDILALSSEEIIRKHGITDAELINRITYEWKGFKVV